MVSAAYLLRPVLAVWISATHVLRPVLAVWVSARHVLRPVLAVWVSARHVLRPVLAVWVSATRVLLQVMASSYTPQSYNLPGPGMYSVILEAGDLANNTKFVRRLVLFDPAPEITSDPNHNLYVSTASAAANYTYQNNASGDIVVTWDRHFRNAIHEDNALLGMHNFHVNTHRHRVRQTQTQS